MAARRGVGFIEQLRCGLRSGSGRGDGRQFAVGPDGAIFEELLFPDGNSFLERVNRVAAGFKGSFAVWRAYGDKDARVTNFKATESVGDGDRIDGKLHVKRRGDFSHLFERHGFVGFVFKVERSAAVGAIANAAVESYDGAIMRPANAANKSFGCDGIAAEEDEVVVG